MNSIDFGWECGFMNSNGANMGITANRDVILTGVQVDCSILSLDGTPGQTHVLFGCAAFPPGGTIQGDPPRVYIGRTPNSDWSSATFNDATGGTAHGGSWGGGCLFAGILKLWAPNAASRVICMPLNYFVPSGGQIWFHMDHAGVPCDAEMQGLFFYQ